MRLFAVRLVPVLAVWMLGLGTLYNSLAGSEHFAAAVAVFSH